MPENTDANDVVKKSNETGQLVELHMRDLLEDMTSTFKACCQPIAEKGGDHCGLLEASTKKYAEAATRVPCDTIPCKKHESTEAPSIKTKTEESGESANELSFLAHIVSDIGKALQQVQEAQSIQAKRDRERDDSLEVFNAMLHDSAKVTFENLQNLVSVGSRMDALERQVARLVQEEPPDVTTKYDAGDTMFSCSRELQEDVDIAVKASRRVRFVEAQVQNIEERIDAEVRRSVSEHLDVTRPHHDSCANISHEYPDLQLVPGVSDSFVRLKQIKSDASHGDSMPHVSPECATCPSNSWDRDLDTSWKGSPPGSLRTTAHACTQQQCLQPFVLPPGATSAPAMSIAPVSPATFAQRTTASGGPPSPRSQNHVTCRRSSDQTFVHQPMAHVVAAAGSVREALPVASQPVCSSGNSLRAPPGQVPTTTTNRRSPIRRCSSVPSMMPSTMPSKAFVQRACFDPASGDNAMATAVPPRDCLNQMKVEI